MASDRKFLKKREKISPGAEVGHLPNICGYVTLFYRGYQKLRDAHGVESLGKHKP